MADYDVFISYRRKDTASVQPLVDALRSRGLTVWFDQSQIEEFAPITNEIRKGLADSKALLAWYSADYPRSRPCQMELTAAFIAAQREGDPRKRVWVINPEEKATHVQPIELCDEQHAKAPKQSGEYGELADLVAKRVRSLSGSLGGIIPLAPPRQFPQTLVSARNFVGRLPDLWRLHSALSGAETAIISGESSSGLAQVSGIGGVGKSLLAEEYALRFGAAYPGGIFWLRALGNDSTGPSLNSDQQMALIADQLRSFGVSLGIVIRDLDAEEIHARLAMKLGSENQSFLWIVDDLGSGLHPNTVRGWLPPHPLGKAIFTTRSREYEEFGQSINLGGLAPEEAVELLCKYRKPQTPEEQLAAKQIANDLGYHPLALAVCSQALKVDTRGFDEFRTALADSSEDELELAGELKGVLPNGHEKSVATTLLRSVSNLEPEGQDLLRIAASLAAAPIPQSLVSATFAEASGIGESEARKRARLARSQVESASLAEWTGDSGLLVHTLVSRAMRFHDREEDKRIQWRAALVRVLDKTLPDVADIRAHKRLELEVFHARELCAAGLYDAEAALLGSWVARHDFERGAYVTARSMDEKVLEVRRRILGEEHPDTLSSMNNLAETLKAQGDLAGARGLQEKVLELRRRILGEEHPHTLTSMNNLASTLDAQGDLAGARGLQEKVLEVCRRILGEEHPDTLSSMNNLALTLRAQGDLAGARGLQEKVLELRRHILGEEHPDTLTSMNNLASTLRAQGDLAGARGLEEKVLELRRRILGEEHPHTLSSMNNLALTLRAQGDLAGARGLEEKVLEVCRRILGEEHPHTLSSMNNLASTLKAQGDLAGARGLQEKVLELRRHILGEEHPDTLSSMNNLALTLRAQGDLAGARGLEEKVLEVCRRILGEEHPHTSMSEWNLLVTAWQSGDVQSVISLREKLSWLLKRDSQRLGATHQQIRKGLEELLKRLPNR